MKRWLSFLLSLYLIVFTAIAVFAMFVLGIPTAENINVVEGIRSLLQNDAIASSLQNTVVSTSMASLLGLLIGGIIAYKYWAYPSPYDRYTFLILIAPAFFPAIVLGLGFIAVSDLFSIRPSLGYMIFAHVIIILPFSINIIRAALTRIDRNEITAAINLGAGSWLVFQRIIFPKLYGAVLVCFLIGLFISFNEFIIGWFTSGFSQTLAVWIYSKTIATLDSEVFISAMLMSIFTMMMIGITIFTIWVIRNEYLNKKPV